MATNRLLFWFLLSVVVHLNTCGHDDWNNKDWFDKALVLMGETSALRVGVQKSQKGGGDRNGSSP